MKSKEEMQDKISKRVFGADAIEIKVTIPDTQIEAALTRFGLTLNNDEERSIFFFDTPTLDLHNARLR